MPKITNSYPPNTVAICSDGRQLIKKENNLWYTVNGLIQPLYPNEVICYKFPKQQNNP